MFTDFLFTAICLGLVWIVALDDRAAPRAPRTEDKQHYDRIHARD